MILKYFLKKKGIMCALKSRAVFTTLKNMGFELSKTKIMECAVV